MDKLNQTIMEKLYAGRYVFDLSDNINEVLNESKDSDEYNLVIDDEEWGNDF